MPFKSPWNTTSPDVATTPLLKIPGVGIFQATFFRAGSQASKKPVHCRGSLISALMSTALSTAPSLARCQFCLVIGPELKFRSDEHKSELQSRMRLSYAVICLHTN